MTSTKIEEHVAKADIKLYLQDRLQGTDAVATDDEVDRLVGMAKGLFIVASTAVKFVEDSYSRSPTSRKERLKVILSVEGSYGDPKSQTLKVPQPSEVAGGPPPFRALDEMYSKILSKALPAEHGRDLEERLRSVLASVVLLFDPLSPKSLEALLHLKADTVIDTLERLHSVIVVPEGDLESSPLRLIHPSFPNFLTTASRCTDLRFFVDPAPQHSRTALLCLNHMSESLRWDMCGIGPLPTLNLDVEDLQDRLKSSVPSHLRYACYYWPSHLVRAGLSPNSDKDLRTQVTQQLASAVEKFVCTKLLCWLEVLSLLGRLDATVPLLKVAEYRLMVSLGDENDAISNSIQASNRAWPTWWKTPWLS